MLNTPKTPPPKPPKFSRTSIIGWLMIIIISFAFVLVFNKTISISEYGNFIVMIVGLLGSIGFLFSKDEE